MPYTPIENGEHWPAYHEQRGRFDGAGGALSGSNPEQPQQLTKEPRQWQIGDLITNLYSGVDALVIGVWRKSLDIVEVSGSARPIGREAANTEWDFRQHCDLRYESDTIEQAERDFNAGLFTAYFKLIA